MLSVRHNDAVLVWAPAKVNLFLEVLAKRSDGYHEIATLLVAVSLTDTLEFKEDASGEIQLTCDQPDLATGPENLIVRAATLLRERTGHKSGVTIRLAKRIPVAAGLAGGSTDAAATLAGLNELWQLGLKSSELSRLAGDIGSDVAFFFEHPQLRSNRRITRGVRKRLVDLRRGRPPALVQDVHHLPLAAAEIAMSVFAGCHILQCY